MIDPVAAYLEEGIAEGWMPGAVWSVSGPDGIVSQGAAGLASIEPERSPTTVETLYDLASLTKPLVTGLALAILEERAQLSLDAPVSDVLPEFDGTAWAGRSLKSFAAHSAGMPAWMPLARRGGGLEAALAEIAAVEPGPEGVTVYSDPGYIALGAVVERISGSTLDAWFAEAVAGPLGLDSIGYASRIDCTEAAPTERGNALERGLAGESGVGLEWRDALIRGETHDGNAHALDGVAGHAGLFGAVRDVVSIGGEILRPKKGVLGAHSRSRLLSELLPGSGRTLGFVLACASGAARGVLPDDAPGHVGFSGTSLWLEPGASRIYVLLTNRVHPVVRDEDFQVLRAGFHRVARGLFPRP